MIQIQRILDTFMYGPEYYRVLDGGSCHVYLPGLTSVGPELHEAATVDEQVVFKGCFISIAIPSIMPTMVIMLIMRAGEIMDLGFEKAFLLQNSINLKYPIISTYVYKIGIQNGQFSYSAAIGLFNNVINLLLLVVVNKIAKRVSDVSLW